MQERRGELVSTLEEISLEEVSDPVTAPEEKASDKPIRQFFFNGGNAVVNVAEGSITKGDTQVIQAGGDQHRVGGNQTVHNIYAHNIPPAELAKLFTDEQKQMHEQIFTPEALRSIRERSAGSIIQMGTLINSVCMITGLSDATGFLVKIPDGRIAFMTAGHVFKDYPAWLERKEEKLLATIDFSQCKLFFGNIDGDEGARAIQTSPTREPLTLA